MNPNEIFKKKTAPLKKYRKQFEPGWDREEKCYYGDIWKNRNQYRPFENFVFQVIEGAVPLLTDSQAGAVVQTDSEELQEQAKTLTKSFDWVMEDQKFPIIKPILVRNSLIGGPGWLHVYWDKHADNGNGKQIFEVLNWKNVWIDGNACLMEDANKAHFKIKRTKDWLKKEYPKYRDEIDKISQDKMDSTESDKDGLERYDTEGKTKRKRPGTCSDDDYLDVDVLYFKDFSMVRISGEQTSEEVEAEKESLMKGDGMDVSIYQDHKAHIEAHSAFWAESMAEIGLPPETSLDEVYSFVEQNIEQMPELNQVLPLLVTLDSHIQEHKELEKENPDGETPEFKDGWHVIEKIGSKIVYDGGVKYDHCEVPLIPWYAYKDQTIYGQNEVRNLYDSQSMQAVMGYKVYKGLQKMANPAKIVDVETGLKPEDISNEDGAMYFIPQGTRIQNMEPGMISPQVDGFFKDRVEIMKQISGLGDMSQGKMPHPNASGFTIEKLEQQTLNRIRLKDRNDQHYSTKRLANIVISNVIQFWTSEKNIRLAGTGNLSENVVFNPLDMIDLDWDVRISAGSMAGVDRNAFNAMLFKLVQMGTISTDQMLEVGDWPKVEKLRSLINENGQIEQQFMQMQEQMQAMQMENIRLKGSLDPEALNPDERKAFDQMQNEKALSEQMEDLQEIQNLGAMENDGTEYRE